MSATTPATHAWSCERGRLLGIAYRMLGDFGLAEDVVSEVAIAAVEAERMPGTTVSSWPAWLTTVCVRRSIDRVRHEAARREEYVGPWLPEPIATEVLPEDAVANQELLSLALLHLAEQLEPEARAALVLHRAFDITAVEIGEILDKSPAAVRQMISRAERRLKIDPESAPPSQSDRAALERLVEAIQHGDFDTVLAMLDPQATLWSDGGGNVRSALNPIFGADKIIRFLQGIISKAVAAGHAVQLDVVGVNGELALDFQQPDRRDIVTAQLDDTGQIRGIRQISNPSKLTHLAG